MRQHGCMLGFMKYLYLLCRLLWSGAQKSIR